MTAHCGHRLDIGDVTMYCINIAGHDGLHTYSEEAWAAA